jgi:hypothetical protein
MNKRDRENLNFLMSLNDKEFEKWMESLDGDDLDYAVDLIRRSRSELLLEEMELMETTQSARFTEARAIIDRIKMLSKDN